MVFIIVGQMYLQQMTLIMQKMYLSSTVFSQGEKLIRDAQTAIISVSTPAALIGVGIGAFIWKFSGGDLLKVATGKKAVFYSIAGWAVVNGITLILGTIQNYL